MIVYWYLIITVISFILSLYLASILGKLKAFKFLYERKNRQENLDGMRGFLALFVFFHHFVVTYYWKAKGVWERPDEIFFQNIGKVGVAVFFMITGFLFLSKILNKKINWLHLYQSRAFRIFPLYVFALFIVSLIVFSSSNFQMKVSFFQLVKQYIKWLGFCGGELNGFSDTEHIIAEVYWTLRYEWIFYFSLPFLTFLLKAYKKLATIMFITVCFILFLYPVNFHAINSKYFILFCIGGFFYYLSIRYSSSKQLMKGWVISTLNMFIIILSVFYPVTLDIFHIILISLFFLLTLLGNDLYGIFSLKSSALLGEISYSIYLLHGIILFCIFTVFNVIEFSHYSFNAFLLLMPLVSVVVVLISAVTFIWIEKPSMDFGRQFKFNLCSINKKYKL